MVGVRSFFTKKLRASSLTEVIVATTLLLLIFAIALTTMQSVLRSSLQKNTMFVEGKLNRLMYRYQNEQLKVPDRFEERQWTIDIRKVAGDTIRYIVFEAVHRHSQKKVVKKLIAN